MGGIFFIMKKNILSLTLIITLILTFALTVIFPVSAYNENNIVWAVEPEFEYESISYCQYCDVLNTGRGINISKSNIISKLNEFSYGESDVHLGYGHGGGGSELFFDENNNMFVVFYSGESGHSLNFYSYDDFTRESNFTNRLNAFRKINSEMIEINNEWGEEYYNLNNAYYGQYAVAYGSEFLTEFIYDYDNRFYISKHGENTIVVQLFDKYGIIDKDGYVAVPFVFDDIGFINNDNAFAKYNGKYGVLDVKKTIFASAPISVSDTSSSIPFLDNYPELKEYFEPVFQAVGGINEFIKNFILEAREFFDSLPSSIKTITNFLIFLAFIGIITSHFLGIRKNRNEWKKHPNYELMYNYFNGSGVHRRKRSFHDARVLLYDRKWSWVSIAGLSYRLGNYSHDSKVLTFLLSLIYIPAAILGFFEMVFRIVIGTVWLIAFNILHRILLFVTKYISILAIPIFKSIDRLLRKKQYCPHCYNDFLLPEFICPKCGKVHKQLIPGRCGILFARCVCNNVFLPCTTFTGRSHLDSNCPACKGGLVVANAKQFSIQLIGGASAGKTSFLAAFQHLYIKKANQKEGLSVYGEPKSQFDDLERMFQTGISEATAGGTSQTYNFVHKYGKGAASDNLVIYDIPGEVIVDGTYARNPKNFGFCDGLVFIVDPLSIQAVRDDCISEDESEALINYSQDNIDTVIVQFIQQFTKIKGLSASEMSDIPVAVVISKVDLKVVKREVGGPKIRTIFNRNPMEYKNNEGIARDKICRDYLSNLGLNNALNNIDAIFSNVHYFPVSAIGRIVGEEMPYEPIGVMEPISWIVKDGRGNMSNLLIEEKERQYANV